MGLGFGSDWQAPSSGAVWGTTSETDPTFNMNGHASGIWDAHSKIRDAITAKEKELGRLAPDDLEVSAVKV